LLHRAKRLPGKDPAKDGGDADDHGERDQRVLQKMGNSKVTLVELRGPAQRRYIGGDGARGRELQATSLALPRHTQLCHQRVADGHDDPPAHSK
jgi:hypothetical protein